MRLFPANVSLIHIGRDRRRRKHQRGTYAVATARPTAIFAVHVTRWVGMELSDDLFATSHRRSENKGTDLGESTCEILMMADQNL